MAVVTGGGRGLGRGIALCLAEAGFDLVLGWVSDEGAVDETATACAAAFPESAGALRVVTVGGNVADASTHKLLLDAAVSLGGPTAWVNNAGVSVLAPVLDTDPSDMARMVEVNLLGTFHGLQAAGRWFREHAALGAEQGPGGEQPSRGGGHQAGPGGAVPDPGAPAGGRIVNLASDLGVQAAANLGGYSATKFAVVGLTQAAAVELAPAGITVNAVCPGTAETDMVRHERASEVSLTGHSPEQVRRAYLDAIPAGRFCTPADVGALVAWLCSPAAAYVTGQAICVNGGSVLH